MAEELKGLILSQLQSGPKTDEELRRTLLGERPSERQRRVRRQYDTRYQALRRALDQLILEGRVAEPRYQLRGEIADTSYLSTLLERYSQEDDDSRLGFILEEVRAECGKPNAAATEGLIEFLQPKLNRSEPLIRELALASLRNLVSQLDDDKISDRKTLQTFAEKLTPQVTKLAKEDGSLQVRRDSINLLSELGHPDSINELSTIIKTESKSGFNELYDELKEAMCLKYDKSNYRKNRLIRNYRIAVHESLLSLTQEKEPDVRKRAEVLLWHFRTGGTGHYPTGEPYQRTK